LKSRYWCYFAAFDKSYRCCNISFSSVLFHSFLDDPCNFV
jgi:hypothetical protein